jgi:hypothetical protein
MSNLKTQATHRNRSFTRLPSKEFENTLKYLYIQELLLKIVETQNLFLA